MESTTTLSRVPLTEDVAKILDEACRRKGLSHHEVVVGLLREVLGDGMNFPLVEIMKSGDVPITKREYAERILFVTPKGVTFPRTVGYALDLTVEEQRRVGDDSYISRLVVEKMRQGGGTKINRETALVIPFLYGKPLKPIMVMDWDEFGSRTFARAKPLRSWSCQEIDGQEYCVNVDTGERSTAMPLVMKILSSPELRSKRVSLEIDITRNPLCLIFDRFGNMGEKL